MYTVHLEEFTMFGKPPKKDEVKEAFCQLTGHRWHKLEGDERSYYYHVIDTLGPSSIYGFVKCTVCFDIRATAYR